MKKILLLSIIVLSAVTAMAQPKIEFDTTSKNVGYVLWRTPVDVTYSFTNKGDKPLVLSRVIPSCGCVTAEWTKVPVMPGASGVVKVTFDAEAIGRFYKDVEILCNASYQPIYLDFDGEVTADSKDYMFTHPFNYNAIRLNKDEIAFGEVARGQKNTVEILIANTSNKAYRPMIMHLPEYLEFEAEPKALSRGDAGKIRLTIDTEKLPEYGMNETSVYLSRYMGDEVSKENMIKVTALLLPDTDNESGYAKNNPPHLSLSAEAIDFSVLKRHQKKSQVMMLTNTGHSDLKIHNIQLSGTSLNVDMKASVIKPGMSVKMKVVVSARNLDRDGKMPEIMLITNDPKQQVVRIPVKGTVMK